VAATAEKVLAAVEEHRSTWQSWHVRAEAQRHLRGVQLPTDKVDQLVELLIEDVLHTRSVALTRTEDISEPEALRRADGSSVYTVAGSELFTSARILEQILARDASPQSASTLLREQQDPAVRLGAATARYLDALYVAADHLARPEMIANLDSAERVFGGLTSEPAWPTVRGQILLVAAGADPVTEPFSAAATRDMTSADDHVEVIDWHTGVAGGGPLPWLPGIPHRLAADPNWGPYLNARSDLVAQLADQVRGNAAEAPAWATQHHALTAELIADIQVWRAATQVEPSDLRPTGPPQLGYSARLCQQQLDKRLAATDTDTEWRWRQLFAAEVPCVTADLFLPELAERLTNLTRAGYDATQLVRSAAAAGPLPDDHPAAALWWRILDQLPQTQPATPKAVPATRRTTAPAPRPRLKPPPAFGPSR
jgi:hypothetical protein